MTTVYHVSVFGGDCTSTLGVFSTKRLAVFGVIKDFAELGYSDEYMLKSSSDALFAVPKDQPELPQHEAMCSGFCLVYGLQEHILDELNPADERIVLE